MAMIINAECKHAATAGGGGGGWGGGGNNFRQNFRRDKISVPPNWLPAPLPLQPQIPNGHQEQHFMGLPTCVPHRSTACHLTAHGVHTVIRLLHPNMQHTYNTQCIPAEEQRKPPTQAAGNSPNCTTVQHIFGGVCSRSSIAHCP